MRNFLICVLAACSCFASANVNAQQFDRLDRKVLLRSVQCELGAFSDVLYREAPQPMQRARVDVEMEVYKAKKIEGGVGFWGLLKGEGEYEFSYRQKGGRPYNVFKDNADACNDRNLVRIELFNCLSEQLDNLKDAEGDASCQNTISGTLAASAGAKIDVWYVNISASGTIKEKRVFKVEVKIPNKR